jgi:hypothetical protein
MTEKYMIVDFHLFARDKLQQQAGDVLWFQVMAAQPHAL